MKAFGRYIILEGIKEVETLGGFEVPEQTTSSERAQKGLVIEPGLDVVGVNKGDVVFYDRARSFPITVDGEMFMMIRDVDIMVIL